MIQIDMEMPSECEYCGFCRYYPENGNVWCNATNRMLKREWKRPNWTHLDVKRPDWCPLSEVTDIAKDINVTGNDLISRQDFDKCLEDAEKEAVKKRKYVFASALNTIRGNLRNFPFAQPETPPYVEEIETEYKKWANVPCINKPLAKALYEVWKKHDREDTNRNG